MNYLSYFSTFPRNPPDLVTCRGCAGVGRLMMASGYCAVCELGHARAEIAELKAKLRKLRKRNEPKDNGRRRPGFDTPAEMRAAVAFMKGRAKKR